MVIRTKEEPFQWSAVSTLALSGGKTGQMDSDWWMFLAGAGVLIGYLVLSALTEMGTKLPWRKK